MELKKATHEGELKFGLNELSCAVLSDGTRILSQSAVYKALDRPVRSKGKVGNRVDQMPSFLDANNLQPFINTELRELINEVKFVGINGKVSKGYNALIVPKVANVYLAARRAGKLTKKQDHVANASELLISFLAEYGITKLVDKATGFDELKERTKEEAALFLERALQLEPAKWVKTFSDEFFEGIFIMKGWTWTITSKKPSVVGHYINDIVYSRIAPNLLSELKKANPRSKKGRKSKHHQHLTTDFGHPLLKEHLSAVVALMKGSDYNWEMFYKLLNKVYPKYTQTLKLKEADSVLKLSSKPLPPLSVFNKSLNTALNHNPRKEKDK